MKVERIQLPPSSVYGSPEGKDSGHRVNSARDSTEQRQNSGQQMRKRSPGDNGAPDDESGDARKSAEPAKPTASQHILNITA
jgi:hypothetical protein